MKQKMVVVEFSFVQYAQGKPGEFRLQSLCAHEPCKLDVIKTVIVRQIRCGELHCAHSQKEDHEQQDGEQKGRQALVHSKIHLNTRKRMDRLARGGACPDDPCELQTADSQRLIITAT